MINLRSRYSKLLNNSSYQRSDFIHKFRLWLAIPGLIVVIYIFFSSRNYESGLVVHCIDNCKSDKKLKINGVVIDKFLEGNNHRGIETIRIKLITGDTLDYYGSWHPTLNYLQINDSIYKKSGTFVFEVYRDGEKVKTTVGDCENCKKGCKVGFGYCNE